VHDAQGALGAVLDEHEAPGLLAVAPHLELLRGANGLAAKRRGRLLTAAWKDERRDEKGGKVYSKQKKV